MSLTTEENELYTTTVLRRSSGCSQGKISQPVREPTRGHTAFTSGELSGGGRYCYEDLSQRPWG